MRFPLRPSSGPHRLKATDEVFAGSLARAATDALPVNGPGKRRNADDVSAAKAVQQNASGQLWIFLFDQQRRWRVELLRQHFSDDFRAFGNEREVVSLAIGDFSERINSK